MSVGIMASAVHVAAGPCTDVLTEPFTNFTANSWTPTSTPTIVAGRTGTAALFNSGGDSITRALSVGEQSDTLTFGFAFQISSLAADRTLIQLRTDTNTTALNNVNVLTTGAVAVTRGTTPAIATTATGLVAINTWYYLEVQINLHDTTGSVTIRLNDTVVASLTNIDTKTSSTKTVYDTIRIIGLGTSINSLYDDMYLSIGSGCTFKGDHAIPMNRRQP